MTKPVLGLSACLVGEAVRYDGGHKDQPWLHHAVLPWVEPVIVCPEAGAGLGVPRPPVHLVAGPTGPRMIGAKDGGLDVTERVTAYVGRLLDSLTAVDGFIVKARSPSCAAHDAPLVLESGKVVAGPGVFTRQLRARLPLLPIADEAALSDDQARQAYFDRVFLYCAFRIARATDEREAWDAFFKLALAVAHLRDLSSGFVDLVTHIQQLRQHPHADTSGLLIDRIFDLALAPRAPQRTQHWLSDDSNVRDLSTAERALRFAL